MSIACNSPYHVNRMETLLGSVSMPSKAGSNGDNTSYVMADHSGKGPESVLRQQRNCLEYTKSVLGIELKLHTDDFPALGRLHEVPPHWRASYEALWNDVTRRPGRFMHDHGTGSSWLKLKRA